MKKLVIGCGPGWPEQKKKYAEQGVEATAVDIIKEFQPDIVFDIRNVDDDVITNLHYKIHGNGGFDEIEAYHVMEHIQLNEDFKRVMWAMYKMLKPGSGLLEICVPYWQSPAALECYEHTRFFNENSFMNFYANPYAKEMGLPLFDLVLNELRPKDGGQEVHVILRKP